MKLNEIVNKTNICAIGNVDYEVDGIAPALLAGKNEIAIAFNDWEIANTVAEVVLTDIMLKKTTKTLLVPMASVYEAAVELAHMFVKLGFYADYSKTVDYKISSKLVRFGPRCKIAKTARIESFSTIGANVTIGENVCIGENVSIGSDVKIGDNVIINAGAKIASPPFYQYGNRRYNDFFGLGTVLIDNNVSIGVNSIIQRGTFSHTIIGANTAIGDLVIVGHDVSVGDNCLISTKTGIGGGAKLEDEVSVYGQCAINNNVIIGKGAIVKADTSVWKNVAAHTIVSGRYGREHKNELMLQAKLRAIAKGGLKNGRLL
jgi:UDP-3-O-[3-hydroxymyristoyl] glucosamine N-acyltransferase